MYLRPSGSNPSPPGVLKPAKAPSSSSRIERKPRRWFDPSRGASAPPGGEMTDLGIDGCSTCSNERASDRCGSRTAQVPEVGRPACARAPDHSPEERTPTRRETNQFPCLLLKSFIARGEGCHAWDVDGNQFIEYGMGLRAITLRTPRHRPVVEAAYRQMQLGTNFSRPLANRRPNVRKPSSASPVAPRW